jgi:gas vesicle protein
MTDEILDTEQPDDTAVRGGGVFVAGLAIGALVGAAAALLLAPDSGRITRQRLKLRLHDLREDAVDELRDGGRKLRRRLQDS